MSRPWTSAEDRQLRQLYAEFGNRALASAFERSVSAIMNRATVLGLTKPPETNRGRFKPGIRPWNTGRKGVRYSPATEFKPGNTPQTWVPVGTEVLDRDGYRKRKVADDRTRPSRFNWKYVDLLIWEAANGPVPPGCAVVFRTLPAQFHPQLSARGRSGRAVDWRAAAEDPQETERPQGT